MLLIQYKPTTYNRAFFKKQNTEMLRCHNTFEMEKAKACFLFSSHPEFSVRYREEHHQAGDRCSFFAYFPIVSPARQHSLHAKPPQAAIHRPRNTAFVHGQMRFLAAPSWCLNSSVFTLCSVIKKPKTRFLCSF